jgi:hypothetical protein
VLYPLRLEGVCSNCSLIAGHIVHVYDLLNVSVMFNHVAQIGLQAFQARTALAPEQCLRYCFQPGAAPLWPSSSHVPTAADIPPCPHCGAQRRFEFQVSFADSLRAVCDLCCGVVAVGEVKCGSVQSNSTET